MREKEFEDKLERNLNKIEPGLSLVERQKRVDTGIIDLFCKDKNGRYVIVETKRKLDTNVIAQLAKYKMALIKRGLTKKRLRTILVAPETSKTVKEVCEFFNFEIKNIYKERTLNKEEKSNNKVGLPNKEELIMFIKSRVLVNLSTIASHFNIKNTTVSDIVNDLVRRKLVEVKKFGGSKIVMVKKNARR